MEKVSIDLRKVGGSWEGKHTSLFVELSEDVLLPIYPFLPENCSWFKAKIISGMQFGRKKAKKKINGLRFYLGHF